MTDPTQGGAKGPTAAPPKASAPRGDAPLELDTSGYSPPLAQRTAPAASRPPPAPATTRPPPPPASARQPAPSALLSLPPKTIASSGPHASSDGARAPPDEKQPKASVLARALGAVAGLLVRGTAVLFRQAKTHGTRALTDFRGRPEHTRWRAYALGSYSLVCIATFAIQAWEPNSLRAYVRVEPVALPSVTVIFVRNDSSKPWTDVKLKLNGQFGYERNALAPGQHFQLPIDRFAAYDANGKATFAPKDLPLHNLVIECCGGAHYEAELTTRK